MNKVLNKSVNPQVVVFWDWQNCRATEDQIQRLQNFARLQGEIFCPKVYADWQLEKKREISDLLYTLGFELLNVPSSKNKPNRTDKKLIEDCKHYVLNNSVVRTVILISGDQDFTALVHTLKSRGKWVIIISRSSDNTSPKLRKSADEFYFISEIEANFNSLPWAA